MTITAPSPPTPSPGHRVWRLSLGRPLPQWRFVSGFWTLLYIYSDFDFIDPFELERAIDAITLGYVLLAPLFSSAQPSQ